jgi:hypothetical protein
VRSVLLRYASDKAEAWSPTLLPIRLDMAFASQLVVAGCQSTDATSE